MSIFAISDLHLSFYKEKPMDIFGKNWTNHFLKIERNWNNKVRPEDLVLIPGDISWALKLIEAEKDLAFINGLNGRKVFIQGNHDYWWNSTGELNRKYKNMYFIKNDFYEWEGIAICGTRGWLCPNDSQFTKNDEKIYKRELQRLKMSLDKANAKGFQEIIVIHHYPPTNDKKQLSEVSEIIRNYPVKKFIYGHLHGSQFYDVSIRGIYENVEYILVSADYLDFDVMKIY